MAEHLLRARLDRHPDWEVCSAGLAAGVGMPASEAAVEAMRELGTNLSAHRSRPVDRALVDGAAVIVVMTADHREQMVSLFPDAAQKIFLLKSFAGDAHAGDIRDPIGADVEMYRGIRDEITKALPGLVAFLESLDFE